MDRLLEPLARMDRPHAPSPADPALACYKEWWHFTLVDEANGIDVILNLSVAGNILAGDAGEANLVALVRQGGRWIGGIDRHDGLAARLARECLDLEIGLSRLHGDGDRLHLKVRRRADDVAVDLVLTPFTEPLVVWKDTPLGRGHINWLILPGLRADGWVEANGTRFNVSGARAYHDHNWGHWQWGDNFGWDWGFSAAAAVIDGAPLSLVYDRTAERHGDRTLEHSLMLWRGSQLAEFFAHRRLQHRTKGLFRGPVRRIPGVAALIDPAMPAAVPARLEIEADDGSNQLRLAYEPETVVQVAVPRETGFGLVTLNESMGWLSLSGRLWGHAISARARACFEFVG
jgi:hypothetical protein